MSTSQTRDGLCAPGEAASSIAFTMVLDVVVGVDSRCRLRGEGRDESLAELGGYRVVAGEERKCVAGTDVFEAADIGVAGCRRGA
jgi:hypothetical protein